MGDPGHSIFLFHSVALLFLYVDDDLHRRLAVVIDVLVSLEVVLEREYLGDQGLQMNLFLIDETDSVHIVVMAVHHGALDIQLVIVRHSEVDLCHACEYSNEHDHASLSGIFDCLTHRDVIASAVIDDVSLVRSEGFDHRVAEILVFRVHAYVDAAPFCLLQT